MKLLFTPTVALLLIGYGTARAQSAPDTLKLGSLQAVIEKALKTNPSQAVYQQQVQQAVYNYRASKGFMYPNLSGSFNGQDNLHLGVTPIPGILIGQPGTTYYAQFGKKYTYNTGLNISENIFDWSAIFQSAIAKNNVELSKMQQTAYVQSLKDQVGKLYYSVLIGKASLKAISRDMVLADSLVNLSKQRLQQGTTDAITVNQAMINYNNVLQNKAQSQQLFDQGIENLKILLGQNAATELSLNEEINLNDIPTLNSLNIGADRGLEVYKQQQEVSVWQSRLQRSAAYPKLALTGYLGAQQFQSDFGLSFANTAWSPYRYIGLSLTVPLFTGLTNTNKYRSAQAQQQIVTLQYQAAQNQSSINDRLLLKNYADYSNMVRASANSYSLYFANVELSRQKYAEGIINMDAYLKVMEDYLRAENTHLSNLSQLLSVKATILSRD